MLELEGSWWRHAGAKDAEIRDRLGISPARYYQLLHALIDTPAAVAGYPATVYRLRRLRALRRRARSVHPIRRIT